MKLIDKSPVTNTKAELASIEAQLSDPKVYASPDSAN